MKTFLSFCLVIIFIPLFALAQSSAGFAEGLWFSKEPFFVGERVDVFTAVRNTSGERVTGTIDFLIDGSIFSSRDFQIDDREVSQIAFSWVADEGDHAFEFKLKNVRTSSGESVGLASKTSGERKQSVDLDTDGDGVGNREDSDDDGDGYSDEEERKEGSDPLSAESTPQPEEDESPQEGKLVDGPKNKAEEYLLDPAKKAAEIAEESSKPLREKAVTALEAKIAKLEKEIEDIKKNSAQVKGESEEAPAEPDKEDGLVEEAGPADEADGASEEEEEEERSGREFFAVSFFSGAKDIFSGGFSKLGEWFEGLSDSAALKIVYKWFLKFLVLILNKWWLAAIAILIILRLLYKLFFGRRRKFA